MSLKTVSRSILCATLGSLSACSDKQPEQQPKMSSLKVPEGYLKLMNIAAVQESFPDSFYDKLKVSKLKADSPSGIIIAVYATHAGSLEEEKKPSLEREIRTASALQSLAVESVVKILPDELISFHPEAIAHDRHLADVNVSIREIQIYRQSMKVLETAYYKAPDVPEAERADALMQEMQGRSKLQQLEKNLYRKLGDSAEIIMQRDIPIRQASDQDLVLKTLVLLERGLTTTDSELKALVEERDRRTVERLQADPERPFRIVTLGKSHDLRSAVLEWNKKHPDRQSGLIEIRCESRDYTDVLKNKLQH